MLTADATQAQMKNALVAGANAFMSKPVKMSALHKKLVAILSRPLVYVRDGRNLRPVLASPASVTPAPRRPPTGAGKPSNRTMATTTTSLSASISGF